MAAPLAALATSSCPIPLHAREQNNQYNKFYQYHMQKQISPNNGRDAEQGPTRHVDAEP